MITLQQKILKIKINRKVSDEEGEDYTNILSVKWRLQ